MLLQIVFFIIFIIFLIISLPYFYSFSFEYKDSLQYQINVKIAFVKLEYSNFTESSKTFISLFNYSKEIKRKNNKLIGEPEEKMIKEKKKSNKSFSIRMINRVNINHLLKFLIKTYKKIKPDKLNLDLLISFADPYYNGLLLAYYLSLKEVKPDFPVNITVNWQENIVEGEGNIAGKIIPVMIFYQLLIFIFSLQTVKIFWQIYKYNK